MTERRLDRSDIIELLGSLSDQLAAEGLHGDLFLVGGAAMALLYDVRRLTADLDGVFQPKMLIYKLANQMAAQHNLPENWLNDGVKGLLPGSDPKARTAFARPGLSVQVPSPQYLFALKVASARMDRDGEDIKTLYKLCGYKNVDEALDAVQQYYGDKRINVRSEYVARELLSESVSPQQLLSSIHVQGTHGTQAICNFWMPLAKRRCKLQMRHKGKHR